MNAEAVPVLAAEVVLCQVISPSVFSTDQPAGGNVELSKPSVTGRSIFPVTKKDFRRVSFKGDSSPDPDEETGSEVYTLIDCCPPGGVNTFNGTVMVASGASETPVTEVVATAPLFNWYETLKLVIGENPT